MQPDLISSFTTGLPCDELELMEALDHVYITRKYQEIGSCSFCKQICKKKCSVCGIHYCSVDCQKADWSNHKVICSKSLFSETLSECGSTGSSDPQKICIKSPGINCDESLLSKDNLVMEARGSPFKVLANQVKGNLVNSSNENQSTPNKNKFKKGKELQSDASYKQKNNGIKKQNYSDKKNLHKPLSINQDRKTPCISPKEELKTSTPEQKKPIAKIGTNLNDAMDLNYEPLKPVENISKCETKNDLRIKNKQKKKVVCVYRESANRYWVMHESDLSTYQGIETILANKCDGFNKAEPKVGLVCAATFADDWYRGKIMSLTPKPSIHFIDYGNMSECNTESIKELPPDLKSLPVEFEEGTPGQYRRENFEGTKVTIEGTGETSDGICRVQIVEGPFETTKKSQPITQPIERSKGESLTVNTVVPAKKKSVIDDLTETSKGVIIFLPGEGKMRFGSLIPEDNEDANHSINQILKLNTSGLSPIEANEGDYVMLDDREGNDQRGRVFSKEGSVYYVQLIDCGVFMSTDCVYALPEEAKDLMELGVKISLLEIYSYDSLMNVETLYFHVTDKQISGQWPCALKGTLEQELIAKALIGKPPVTLEVETKFVSLKPGSVVVISALCSPNSFYIRAVDEDTEQKILEMNTKMAQCMVKAESLKSPKPGQLCCAKFSVDKCFYRAEIISVKNNKVYVLFVDFGNKQETELTNVKHLPNGLKLIPYFALKVALRNVTKPFTPAVSGYLKKLITKNVELTLTFEGPISEGVVLKENATGIVLNDYINNSKEENRIEQCPEKSDQLTDDALTFMALTPGTKCSLLLLYISEQEFNTSLTFWATDHGSENLTYLTTQLFENVAAYCGSSTEPYRPNIRELCLAEFEGSWYRALTTEIRGDNKFEVFFFDFGNTCELTSESIRKIKPEFVEAPALAVKCVLSGCENLAKVPELKKKVFDLLNERVGDFFVEVEVTKSENEAFSIKIPEIDSFCFNVDTE